MKAFLAPRGVVHWFLAGVREQSRHSQKDIVRLNWLGTQNSGVPSDLEGGSNAAPAGPRKSLSAVAQPRLAKSLTPC